MARSTGDTRTHTCGTCVVMQAVSLNLRVSTITAGFAAAVVVIVIS